LKTLGHEGRCSLIENQIIRKRLLENEKVRCVLKENPLIAHEVLINVPQG
jgi:hypothetical protein